MVHDPIRLRRIPVARPDMEIFMTLSLVSVNPTAFAIPARLSYDLRNALATLSLHIESLERLSGPAGTKAASAAHALISKAVEICTEVLEDAANPGTLTRRTNVD